MDTKQGWTPADTFGTRLMLVRREKKLSVEVAAATAGVKQASWSSWERGARPRNLAEVVAAVSDTFGVDRDWLMWGSTGTAYHPTTERYQGDSRPVPALVAA